MSTDRGAAAADSDLERDDSGYGPLMFYVFTGSVLLVTGAVCALAAVGSWWMLGVVVAIHMIFTAIVTWVIYEAFGSATDADGEESDESPDLSPDPRRQPRRAVPHSSGTLV